MAKIISIIMFIWKKSPLLTKWHSDNYSKLQQIWIFNHSTNLADVFNVYNTASQNIFLYIHMSNII